MKRRTPTGSVAIGFSVKTCLRAFTGGLEMLGPVPGRRGQHHDVEVGVDDFLERIEAAEPVFGRPP